MTPTGLPEAYAPWGVEALYDSGEKLYFFENGAPEADWTGAFRDYFVEVMAGAGDRQRKHSKEALPADWPKMKAALMTYLNQYIEAHRVSLPEMA